MGLKSGGFERKSKASEKIPSSSLADIAFLLLIFFMVTTVFRTERERPIDWPAAIATEQIDEKRDNILYVWLERNGDVWINDRLVAMADVAAVVGPAWLESGQRLIISLRADSQVPYRFVDLLQEQLKRSGAVYVVFATELERRMTAERR
ncbi:MAG: biopolymer transporter ExbD [Gammaproteobacteria bacterium]|nr:biopolymer transporter ExbD [Gammaproteobacteria bacterium]MDE0247077.1 biopolymer transporter ExbD [Gammaproteobacteria bacterium]